MRGQGNHQQAREFPIIWIIGLCRRNRPCTTESIFSDKACLVVATEKYALWYRTNFFYLLFSISTYIGYGVSHPKIFSLYVSLSFSLCLTVSCMLCTCPSLPLNFHHCHRYKPPPPLPWASALSPALPEFNSEPHSSFRLEQPRWYIQQEISSRPICQPRHLSLASCF